MMFFAWTVNPCAKIGKIIYNGVAWGKKVKKKWKTVVKRHKSRTIQTNETGVFCANVIFFVFL